MLFFVQLGICIYMSITLRIASKERAEVNKEIFGLTKKIEGLTSSKREQILKSYDKILENLSARLPITIASQTSNLIFEAESKILCRLAELEPNLKENEEGKKKMDELIKSMEGLEQTLVSLTTDAVKKVFVESRTTLLDEQEFSLN